MNVSGSIRLRDPPSRWHVCHMMHISIWRIRKAAAPIWPLIRRPASAVMAIFAMEWLHDTKTWWFLSLSFSASIKVLNPGPLRKGKRRNRSLFSLGRMTNSYHFSIVANQEYSNFATEPQITESWMKYGQLSCLWLSLTTDWLFNNWLNISRQT